MRANSSTVVRQIRCPSLAPSSSRSPRGVHRAVSALVGGNELVAMRLRQAGSPITVEEFRSRQLLWAAVAAALAIVASVALASIQSLPIAAPFALVRWLRRLPDSPFVTTSSSATPQHGCGG